jgi:TonB family protein
LTLGVCQAVALARICQTPVVTSRAALEPIDTRTTFPSTATRWERSLVFEHLPIRRSYGSVGLGLSLALHVSVGFAAALLHAPFRAPSLLPVEAGPNSIALTASMASAGNADEGDVNTVEVSLPTDLPAERETVAPQLAPEMNLARNHPTRNLVATAPPTKDLLELPSEELLALIEPDVDRVEPSGDPTMNSQRDATLPRAVIDVSLKIEQVSAALRSDPSPNSAAINGAEVDEQPAPVYNPGPTYPIESRKARETGRVLLSVTVAVNGTVSAAEIAESSGFAALDRAALDVVRRWRFRPAQRAGQPVEHTIGVPVRFRLSD